MKRCPAARENGARRNDPEQRGGAVRYRIVVNGEIAASFVGPLAGMAVESAGQQSTLSIDIVDQRHLRGVLGSLSDRGIEIVGFAADLEQGSTGPGPAPASNHEGWPI